MDEDGNIVMEEERDRVIITGERGEYLEGEDLNTAMEHSMGLVEADQAEGRRVIAFEEWRRSRGHLSVLPTDGPATAQGRTSARQSGEALIDLATGHRIPLQGYHDGYTLPLLARWSSQLPRVSQWSVRYQGTARDARALIESPFRGIGVMNGLGEVARGQIRFISAHEVTSDTGSRDTIIRFEVGETAAAELQGVIGTRGGQIRIGATSTRVQHNRHDITAETVITFHMQS